MLGCEGVEADLRRHSDALAVDEREKLVVVEHLGLAIWLG